jgi:ribosomal protein S18 acetylase RimI-like enzyme
MLKAEAAQGPDEKIVKDIVLINRHSYPTGWEYSGAKEYYRQMLMNQKNICIMLRDDEKSVGFLLAIPHNDAVGALKGDDEFMEQDPKIYYIENAAILPGYRGEKGFSQMLGVLRQELQKRGIFTISLHARVSNNLSKNIQKNMKIIKVRRIEAWRYYNDQEPTEYLEATWPSNSGDKA